MRKKINKKKLVGYALTILIFGIIIGLADYSTYKKEQENYNRAINAVAYTVLDKYPETNITDLFIAIDNASTGDYAEEIFARYGIDIKTESIIQNNDEIYRNKILIHTGLYLMLVITLVIIYYLDYRSRYKKVDEIAKYIEQILKGNYSLVIDNNTEDELSILKNEVYKVTIMLKEAANTANSDKKELKDSLSDISHQLKTPITSLLINLDNLSENPDIDVELRQKFIKNAIRDVNNISSLVQYILKLSKLDANTITFKKKETNIREIIDESIKNVSALSDLKDVTINVNGPNEQILICDPYWQVEAVTNVLKNAIEYADSKVYINYTGNNVFTEIEIYNDGIIIPEEDRKHIFERFYRGKNQDKDSVGIGLALSKAIIEQDGGHITCDNFKITKFIIRYLH